MNSGTPQTAVDEVQKQTRQRGATLTGYALTLALMLITSLTAISFLETTGEDFLSESGTNIGTARSSAIAAQMDDLSGNSSSGNSLGPATPP